MNGILSLLCLSLLVWASGLCESRLSESDALIFWDIHVPRVLCGALAGALLAWAGATAQGLFRNPLASPSVLGIESMATLCVVAAIFFGPFFNLTVGIGAAFLGATAALVALLIFNLMFSGRQIIWILLFGFALNAFCNALSSFLLSYYAYDLQKVALATAVSLGNLQGRTYQHVMILLVGTFLASGFLLRKGRVLDILTQGEDYATAVGVNVKRLTFECLALIAIVVACATAGGAPLPFVGLLVPLMTRVVCGPKFRDGFFINGILGASMVVGADFLGRSVFANREIDAGVIVALVGAPTFLAVVVREMRRGAR